jgi:Family of unknown function (DUF6288)/PA14 domain/Bacterial Ig domain
MKAFDRTTIIKTLVRVTVLMLALPCVLTAAPPDLTAPGAIAVLKTNLNAKPVYAETYNLGATGLRGWIHIGGGTPYDGTLTVDSRQILVTVASTPGSAVLAVDDVILGAMAASSGVVPLFTNDCRKAIGAAISDAEKTGAGTLRVKRWRAGATNDVNIAVTILGNYTATAPYSCPKSALILSNACNKLVSQLLADEDFLAVDYAGAINGLALLAGVAPGDPNYATVQVRLQTFARDCAASIRSYAYPTWHVGYLGLFLSEYYLLTGDSQVVSGLNNYIVTLAKMQSRYGTYGHGGAGMNDDGSLHGTTPPYGPVNGASIPANLAIVIGKKALLAAGQALDPEIDPAIYRASQFYGWYANKGGIPYGEHEPNFGYHSIGGRDAMCAVMFGLQTGRSVETEFFTRYTIASFDGREYAHAGGQAFSFLWDAMGANVGGQLAVGEYLKQIRWHIDMVRRTDGSFAYEGREQFGGGSTSDGTYLGESRGYGYQTTAGYILTYSLPLKRIYITGKNANPTNTLDAAKVADAIAAATFSRDVAGFTTTQLIAGLSAFDPVVRNAAAIELAKRSLSAGQLTTLRGMLTSAHADERMAACQTLGLLKDTSSLSLIAQRLDKTVETNSWVRALAAYALGQYGATAASTQHTPMLNAFIANATDPEVTDWDDPFQCANTYLSFKLFGFGSFAGTLEAYTIKAPKNLLYPALKVGLKQPDALARGGVSRFCCDRLSLTDVQSLALDIFEVITSKSQANSMFSMDPQVAGLELLMKHKCAEALPIALSLMDVKEGWAWGAPDFLSPCLDKMATFGDSARWVIPFLNEDITTLQPVLDIGDYTLTVPKIQSTIATIDSAINSPSGLIHLLPLASNQVVVTSGAMAITLSGYSCRTNAVVFTNVTMPAHGTLTGTPPNLTYTPTGGYTGPDSFTFQVADSLTSSVPGTVSIIVGAAGTGLKGHYYNKMDFTDYVFSRIDPQVNFDWGTGSPDALLGPDTFSVRWSGLLLVPETGTYTFSTLNSDGVRLYVNGIDVIDDLTEQATGWEDSAPVSLTAGQWVEIQMDYFENTGSAVAKLKWTGPSFAGINGTIIGSQWLFDGTGMPRTPYAFDQSLTVLMNKSTAITLTAAIGAVSYSIVTQPTNGSLTGTAPNLTYTPSANYIGLDSFTFKASNGTTDSVPATVSIDVIPANIFSVNFFANGGLTDLEAQANLRLESTVSAGLSNWFTYGWFNIEVPWGLSEPQAPVSLKSNQRSSAAFLFKDCRNGGPYVWSIPRTNLLGNASGNMMDSHANGTLAPGDGSALFDMAVTNIPFAVYDVIFYMGANQDQYGTGTGVIKFNGGPDRAFTIKPGAFDGTFTEMVTAVTQGNYLIFRGVTGSSFTAQTWGTGPDGFNHLGPCGFQVKEVVIDNTPPVVNAGTNQTVLLSGSTPWTPAQIATLTWYDATDTETLWADTARTIPATSSVLAWDDKSGNNKTIMAASGTEPQTGTTNTIGGLSSLFFQQGDKMNSSSITVPTNGNMAVYMVVDYISKDQERALFKLGGPFMSITGTGGQYKWNTTTLAGTYNDPIVLGAVYDWAAGQYHVLVTGGNKLDSSYTAKSYNDSLLLLRNNNNAAGISANVGEIIVCADITDVTRQKVEGYLAWKWGLQANLPADHPYKNAAPGAATAVANLAGSASDADGDPLTTAWSVDSPTNSGVTFANAAVTNTTATFASAGTYVLRLTASDTFTQTVSQITITVTTNAVIIPPARTVAGNVPTEWLATAVPSSTNNFEAAAVADPDNDGYTTAQEYWSGTDPLNTDSFLKLDSVEINRANVVLKWRHARVDVGLVPITIQARSNLVSGTWGDIGTHAPSNGVNTWSGGSFVQGFYRLTVTNAP